MYSLAVAEKVAGTSRYWSYQSMTDPTSAVYMGWRESFDWAQASKVPIFYGEFGTQPFGNGWVQYVSEQIDLAERWGAAWALFNYHEPSYGGEPGGNGLSGWDLFCRHSHCW